MATILDDKTDMSTTVNEKEEYATNDVKEPLGRTPIKRDQEYEGNERKKNEDGRRTEITLIKNSFILLQVNKEFTEDELTSNKIRRRRRLVRKSPISLENVSSKKRMKITSQKLKGRVLIESDSSSDDEENYNRQNAKRPCCGLL